MSASDRALLKKMGQLAARYWIKRAQISDVVWLAGLEASYDEELVSVLRDLDVRSQGSNSHDFAWGFYKQVKCHVFNLVYQYRVTQ